MIFITLASVSFNQEQYGESDEINIVIFVGISV